jgi:arylsulfatase A-like enzyme
MAPATSPNIVRILVDTLRRDHLSCYGYRRRTSPSIDRLAQESKLYTRAISPGAWTVPSQASIFTDNTMLVFCSDHGENLGVVHATPVDSTEDLDADIRRLQDLGYIED